MRPVKRATRPKTKSPRCCEGVRPMSQSFSENPGIAVPPILRHAEDGRGARQDQQEREESEDDQEEPREHVDVFHEDRGGEEPEDEEEHAQWPASGPQTRPRFSRAATASGGSVPATRVRLRSVNIAPTSNKNSPKIIIRPTSRRRSMNIGPRIIGGGGCIRFSP